MTHQAPHTVAILGEDPVVENALALLLEGAGYSVKILRDSRVAHVDEQLEGVDLVLLAPSLFEEGKEAFLKAVEADPGAGGARVLALSTAPDRELEGRTGVVPWPLPFEGLLEAIEEVLAHEEEKG